MWRNSSDTNNANKALNKLRFDHLFEEEDVNPIVINGLSIKTKSFDFFSLKGNGDKKSTVEPLKDSDFFFDKKGVISWDGLN